MNTWRYDDVEITALLHEGELAEIRADWERLAEHPAIDPDAYCHRLVADPEVVGPAVLVARRRGDVAGLFVGRIEAKCLDFRIGYLPVYRPRARVLAGLDRGLVCVDDPAVATAFIRSIMSLLGARLADFAHLSSVPLDSPVWRLARVIPPVLCRNRITVVEPRWQLTLPKAFDDFLATRSRNTRSNIRRHERALREAHPDVRIVVHGPTAQDMASALDAVLHVCRQTYQYQLGLTPLRHPRSRETWLEASRLGRLALVLVYVADRPVAFSYAHIYKSSAVFMTPGYDPALAPLHVGEYALLHLIRSLIELGGVTSLDYGLGDAQYKESFGTTRTCEGHVRIFAPSLRGLTLNVVRTGTMGASTSLSFAARRLGLHRAIKRRLRSRRPSSTAPDRPAATATPPTPVS